MKQIPWDNYFMSLAYLVATRSKDQTTHNGSIVVGPDNEIRSMGYNSFPRGINDNKKERQIRPEKYYWIEHSERNAIYNATLIGASLKGCKIYSTMFPCMECAKAIVQSGIKEVIVDSNWNIHDIETWREHSKRAIQLFKEAKIKVRYWKGRLLRIHKYRDGKMSI